MLPQAQLDDLLNQAKFKFGVTDSLREAGYLLPDGTLLDFRRGDVGNEYGDDDYVEHYEIEKLAGINSIEDFLSKTCSARLVQEDYHGGQYDTIVVEMAKGCEPTQAQLNVLRSAGDLDGYSSVMFDVYDPESATGSYVSVVSPPDRVALAINRAYHEAKTKGS